MKLVVLDSVTNHGIFWLAVKTWCCTKMFAEK